MVCSVAKLDRAFRLVDACVFDWHDPPRRAGVLRTPRQGGGKSRAGHPRMGFRLRFIDLPRKSRVFFLNGSWTYAQKTDIGDDIDFGMVF